MAAPAIFYSHWQLDLLKTVLRQKSKFVARVARCPQYLQRVAKSSVRGIFCNIVPAILWQNLPLAICATFWFHNPCNIRRKCCVASASKNVARVAAAKHCAIFTISLRSQILRRQTLLVKTVLITDGTFVFPGAV